ncbi:MAG TPA: hypothetical protein VFL72_07815, partial [Acidimicrobiia bacterium]|nr:hypothetical protein [Acidimicrobiia bacterium]
MTGRITSRLGRAGLALAVAFGTLTVGALPALAETLVATEVNAIDTSTWTPPTPPIDPSGVAYIGPNLLVTDMNGAITSNAWDYQVTPPLATIKLLGPSGILEPTGVEYDAAHDRVFVSSDALNNNAIHVINNYSTSPAVLTINVEAFSGDTEDPAFDP